MSLDLIQKAIQQTNQIILGKERQIQLAFACLLSGGHLLLDDRPGTGKTTLSKTLAQCLGLSMARIQFTSDLMPSDIIGVSILHREHSEMVFHPGPIFHHIVLADEINRASPRTQSALLEAMSEHQVSVDGKTYSLPSSFFVIATQNPLEFSGTNPLPEAQADRFSLNLELGYPDPESEKNILKHLDNFDENKSILIQSPLSEDILLQAQSEIHQIHVSDEVVEFLYTLIERTRQNPKLAFGLSTRAAMQILKLSKAIAYLRNQTSVFPEDIRSVFIHASKHRLKTKSSHKDDIQHILNEITHA